MATLAQLLKARKILEDQLGRLSSQLDNSPIQDGIAKVQRAVGEDISSNNIQIVTDGLHRLYKAKLSTEQGQTNDAIANVQQAIEEINAEISAFGAE